MADVSIRNLDDEVRRRLRERAARNGRSMEAEMRAILTESVMEVSELEGLLVALLDRFQEVGGVELELPERSTPPRAPEFR